MQILKNEMLNYELCFKWKKLQYIRKGFSVLSELQGVVSKTSTL